MTNNAKRSKKKKPWYKTMMIFYIHIKTYKLSQPFHQMQIPKKRPLYAFISLLLLYLLAYNTFTPFSIKIPLSQFHEKPEKPKKLSSFSSSAVIHVPKEQNPVVKTDSQLKLSHKNRILKKGRWRKTLSNILGQRTQVKNFSTRVKDFFFNANNSSCDLRFFMTWISSLDSFGDRELISIQSLFKSHPTSCLIIVSNSMDSRQGMSILSPFLDKGFRVTAITPNYNYLFKNTVAETWLHKLIKGNVVPGSIAFGQNLSNLLRLGLLYKFGGIYLDTDVLVLRSFSPLKNAIGAQTIDGVTRNWTRLNNAVMVFDKGHPLVYKFIEEFALTFDGNKWGHNGPYLVSRVFLREKENPGYNNITVLPPMAFYPVDWNRIAGYFTRVRDDDGDDDGQAKWLRHKLKQIRGNSFAVHLWNKQSRKLVIQEGSIVQHLVLDCCIFCNSTSLSL